MNVHGGRLQIVKTEMVYIQYIHIYIESFECSAIPYSLSSLSERGDGIVGVLVLDRS